MRVTTWGAAAAVVALAGVAHAEPSALALRALGAGAADVLSPRRTLALVRLPPEVEPRTLGLRPLVPGLAVLEGDAATMAGFARAHPEASVELHPPLRPKLDVERAYVGAPTLGGPSALDGAGTIVGVVDTGLDVAHRDFRNADGTTRVLYFLDYSTPKRPGNALDEQYGGRVWTRAELDALLTSGVASTGPTDPDGHGTHVMGIAAGNGGAARRFVGLAPKADLIVVRASDARGNVDEAAAVLGVKFIFDRAAESKQPAAVNLSLGTQYGAHDGTSSFERGLVALASGPGRAIVVAASNEGWLPIHTGLRVRPGVSYRIPVQLRGARGKGEPYVAGQVFAWINKRDRGDVRVGLRAPDGSSWLPPVPKGKALEARPSAGLRAVVANDVPSYLDGADTSAAIAILSGALPVGRFELELEGDGAVELWLQGAGEAIDGPGMPLFPQGGLIEGTIGVPASAAGLLSVGCVAARTSFVNLKGQTMPVDAAIGERCTFSSVGPATTGHARPDLLAPGLYVVSALARSAYLASPLGEFDTTQIVDPEHGALAGTSMSAPFAAGAAALLFQRDPTLTQEDVRALLQAGARRLSNEPTGGGTAGDPAHGGGILDVGGALAALDRRSAPPAATSLTLRLGATWLAADGGVPLYGLVTAHDGEGRPADVPGGLTLEADRALVADALSHPSVGVYRFSVVAAPGAGLERATLRLRGTLGVTREVPIGADFWDAHGGMRASGGCAVGATSVKTASRATSPASGPWTLALVGALTCLRRRSRARSRAAAKAAPSGAMVGSDRPR